MEMVLMAIAVLAALTAGVLARAAFVAWRDGALCPARHRSALDDDEFTASMAEWGDLHARRGNRE